MKERKMSVKGRGKISVRADLTTVTFIVKSFSKEYSETIKLAAVESESIFSALGNIGFKREDIKTADFNIRTEYENLKDENDNWKQVLKGYSCSHTLKLEFDFNKDKLGEVLSAISLSSVNPEIYIDFSVRDCKKISQALLADAVNNALENAKVLAETSGVILGEIVSIEYDFLDVPWASGTRLSTSNIALRDAMSLNIEPQNVSATESVSIIFSIV